MSTSISEGKSATNMKLFQAPHTQATTFPTLHCVRAIGKFVLFSSKDCQQSAKTEQLGIQFERKWSFLRRKVNDNLCKKFSPLDTFSSFII
jgi:hypothetical protein